MTTSSTNVPVPVTFDRTDPGSENVTIPADRVVTFTVIGGGGGGLVGGGGGDGGRTAEYTEGGGGSGSAIATGATSASAISADSPATRTTPPGTGPGTGGQRGYSRNSPDQFGPPGKNGRVFLSWMP